MVKDVLITEDSRSYIYGMRQSEVIIALHRSVQPDPGINRLPGVGFEPTHYNEYQNLSLAP